MAKYRTPPEASPPRSSPYASPSWDACPERDDQLDSKYAHWRGRTFAVTWLAYAAYYLTRKSFAVAKIAVGPGTEIGLTKSQMAGIDTAYSCAYALGQFLCGPAADRWGTRRVVLLGMTMSIVAACAMGLSSTAWTFGLFFLVQGLCQASGWAPLTKNVSQFFSRRERGSVMGLWCTNYAVGGLVGGLLAAQVAERFGWRAAFWIPAGIALVVTALFFALQRNTPEDAGLPSIDQYHGDPAESPPAAMSADAAVPENALRIALDVLSRPMVLVLCGVYFLLKPARYLFLFWGPTYVHETLGSDIGDAGLVASAFELGGPLGAIVGGIVSDRCFSARRAPVCVCSLAALATLLYFMDDLPETPEAYGIALFFVGVFMFAADSLLSGAAAMDFGTKERAATASGLINGTGSVGQILGPAIPALIPETWGWHEIFCLLSAMMLTAALALAPKWNAVPAERSVP